MSTRTPRHPAALTAAPAPPAAAAGRMLRTGVAPGSAPGSAVLSVDADAGLIANVPVITAGLTAADGLGNPPCLVDAVTLQQVADAINAAPGGVKSRMTHAELEGQDGIKWMAGSFTNARVDQPDKQNARVLADFRFGGYATSSPVGDIRAYLTALALESPRSLGVSIYAYDCSVTADTNALRLGTLDAIDWVGAPAANPNGLLSRPRPSQPRLSRPRPSQPPTPNSTSRPTTTRPARVAAQQAQGAVAMNFNQAQMQYMIERGLDPAADQQQATEFYALLTPEEQAEVDALGDAADTPTDDAAAAGGGAAQSRRNPAGATAGAADADDDADDDGGDDDDDDAADAAAINPAALAAARRQERARFAAVNQISEQAGLGAAFCNRMFLSNRSVADIRRVALERIAARRGAAAPRSAGHISGGSDRNLDTLGPAVRDALLTRAGVRLAQPHARAADFSGMRAHEIMRTYLQARGVRTQGMDARQVVRLCFNRADLSRALGGVALGHSTSDFDYILADAINKSLRTAYELAEPTWQQWCRRGPDVPDFKDISVTQLSSFSDVAEIPEGGPYTYGTLSDTRAVWRVVKYGKGFLITWEALINDDLSAFDRIPTAMSQSCLRKQESLVYGLLGTVAQGQVMDEDSKELFHADHANTGTSAALTAASLGETESFMMLQKAFGGGDYLNLTAKHLLVPPALHITAKQLASSTILPGGTNEERNPYAGLLNVVVSPFLKAHDANGWWLVADYNQIDTAEMRFLEGHGSPVLETEDKFDVDARAYKVRQVFGARVIDYRGFAVNAGGS